MIRVALIVAMSMMSACDGFEPQAVGRDAGTFTAALEGVPSVDGVFVVPGDEDRPVLTVSHGELLPGSELVLRASGPITFAHPGAAEAGKMLTLRVGAAANDLSIPIQIGVREPASASIEVALGLERETVALRLEPFEATIGMCWVEGNAACDVAGTPAADGGVPDGSAPRLPPRAVPAVGDELTIRIMVPALPSARTLTLTTTGGLAFVTGTGRTREHPLLRGAATTIIERVRIGAGGLNQLQGTAGSGVSGQLTLVGEPFEAMIGMCWLEGDAACERPSDIVPSPTEDGGVLDGGAAPPLGEPAVGDELTIRIDVPGLPTSRMLTLTTSGGLSFATGTGPTREHPLLANQATSVVVRTRVDASGVGELRAAAGSGVSGRLTILSQSFRATVGMCWVEGDVTCEPPSDLPPAPMEDGGVLDGSSPTSPRPVPAVGDEMTIRIDVPAVPSSRMLTLTAGGGLAFATGTGPTREHALVDGHATSLVERVRVQARGLGELRAAAGSGVSGRLTILGGDALVGVAEVAFDGLAGTQTQNRVTLCASAPTGSVMVATDDGAIDSTIPLGPLVGCPEGYEGGNFARWTGSSEVVRLALTPPGSTRAVFDTFTPVGLVRTATAVLSPAVPVVWTVDDADGGTGNATARVEVLISGQVEGIGDLPLRGVAVSPRAPDRITVTATATDETGVTELRITRPGDLLLGELDLVISERFRATLSLP